MKKNLMNKQALHLLQDLFQRTSLYTFMTLDALETEFGASGSELRPLLEDLKDKGLIVEHKEGFQISPAGINFSKTKWI